MGFLHLAWRAFQAKYENNPKRYADWPRVFQNAVEGDWLKLWRIDQASGSYVLTTAGHQLDRKLEADEREWDRKARERDRNGAQPRVLPPLTAD